MAPRAFLLSAWLTRRALCNCQRRLPVWPFAVAWCGWVAVVVMSKIFAV